MPTDRIDSGPDVVPPHRAGPPCGASRHDGGAKQADGPMLTPIRRPRPQSGDPTVTTPKDQPRPPTVRPITAADLPALKDVVASTDLFPPEMLDDMTTCS